MQVAERGLVAVFFSLSPQEWRIQEIFEVPGYFSYCCAAFLSHQLMDRWPHELVGGFLAILLVFRTDQVGRLATVRWR